MYLSEAVDEIREKLARHRLNIGIRSIATAEAWLVKRKWKEWGW